jgi:hypothetical protein
VFNKGIKPTGKGQSLRTKVPKEVQDLIIATVSNKKQKIVWMRVREQFLKFQLQCSQARSQKGADVAWVTYWSPNTFETFSDDWK